MLPEAEDTAQVSVVVPVWGGYTDAYLGEALASLLSEPLIHEVIVVDNASATPVRVGHERVVIVRSARRVSCGEARNLGLARVRTAMMMMWDADDLMLPGTVELLHRRLAGDRRLVAAAATIVDWPAGTRHRWPRRWISRLSARPRLLAVLNSIWSQYPTVGATLMLTDAVRDAGGYAEGRVSEDWSLGAALLWRGRVAWSERPGRLYRRHPSSSWVKHNGTMQLVANAHEVRDLLRSDEAVPAWFTAMLPAVGIVQLVLLLLVQPVIRLLRGGRAV